MDVLRAVSAARERRSTRWRSSAASPASSAWTAPQVWPAWRRGEIEAIRNYCETDVANTYLLFQRFQMIRGLLTPEAYARELELARAFISGQPSPHWKEFAAAWK